MTLPPRSALWRAALAGAFGAASGFALFLLWWEEGETHERPVVFLLALLVAAGVSFAFESFRDDVEGREEKRTRLPDTLVTITLLAIFELFVLGLHTTISLATRLPELKQVGDLVLGQALVGRSNVYLHLAVMVFLWVSAAAALTMGFCVAVFDPACALPPLYAWREVTAWAKPTMRAAGTGGLTGVVVGPLAVLGYTLCVRALAEVKMILFDTDAFTAHIRGLAERAPLPWNIPIGALRLLFGSLGTLLGARWGPILALGLSLGLGAWSLRTSVKWPAVVVGVVYAIPLFGGAGYLLKLAVAVAAVWALPGIVLGAMIPWLRTPSRYPALWGFVALGAAVILLGLAWAVRDTPVAAGLTVSLGLGFAGAGVVLFWRGGAIERYWPILALSVAINVLGGTRLMQGIDFFNIQKEAYFFSRSPLLTLHPAEPQLGPVPDTSWARLSRQIQQFGAFVDSTSSVTRGRQMSLGLHLVPIRPVPLRVARSAAAMAARVRDMAAVERTMTDRYERLRMSLEIAQRSFSQSETVGLQDQAERLDVLRAAAPGLQALAARLTADISTLLDSELARPAPEESPSRPRPFFTDSDDVAALQQDRAELTRKREVFERQLGNLATATRAIHASVTAYQERLDSAREALHRQIESERRLELTMTASLGFWATIGILAAWAVRRTPGHGGGDTTAPPTQNSSAA